MIFIVKILRFFKDSYNELTKVIWLNLKKVLAVTFVVIIFVIFVSVFVNFTDLILRKTITIML
jgi:preprotein translocase SecE subunit